MKSKYVIFVLISSLLVAAIYSSSVSHVFARIACAKLTNDPNSYTCTSDKTKEITLCTKTKKGWDCQILTDRIDTNIPPALKDAMDAAIQETQNTTKVTNTDVLNDSVTLQENNDNGKEPKAPKVPDDLGGLNDN